MKNISASDRQTIVEMLLKRYAHMHSDLEHVLVVADQAEDDLLRYACTELDCWHQDGDLCGLITGYDLQTSMYYAFALGYMARMQEASTESPA